MFWKCAPLRSIWNSRRARKTHRNTGAARSHVTSRAVTGLKRTEKNTPVWLRTTLFSVGGSVAASSRVRGEGSGGGSALASAASKDDGRRSRCRGLGREPADMVLRSPSYQVSHFYGWSPPSFLHERRDLRRRGKNGDLKTEMVSPFPAQTQWASPGSGSADLKGKHYGAIFTSPCFILTPNGARCYLKTRSPSNKRTGRRTLRFGGFVQSKSPAVWQWQPCFSDHRQERPTVRSRLLHNHCNINVRFCCGSLREARSEGEVS